MAVEPGIYCSGGGRDDHYATPPGQKNATLQIVDLHSATIKV
jgi:hypothetical protein